MSDAGAAVSCASARGGPRGAVQPHPALLLGTAAILGRERDRLVESLVPLFSSIDRFLVRHTPAEVAAWRGRCDWLLDHLRRLDFADPAARAELLAATTILLRTADALAREGGVRGRGVPP